MAQRASRTNNQNDSGIEQPVTGPVGEPITTAEPIAEQTGGDGGIATFDPITGASDSASDGIGGTGSGFDPSGGSGGSHAAERKRRGRKPGSKNINSKSLAENLTGVETMLSMLHSMVAMVTGIAEIALSDEESKMLASAAINVAKHYPIGASEKTLAWANLCMVAGGLYGTRIVAIAKSSKKQTPKIVPMRETSEKQPVNGSPKPDKKVSIINPPFEFHHQSPGDDIEL